MQTISSISPLSIGHCPNLKQPLHAHISTPIITTHNRKPTTSLCYINKHAQTQHKTHSPTTTNTTTSTTNHFHETKDLILTEMYSFLDNNNTNNKTQTQGPFEQKQTALAQTNVHSGNSSNMWWNNIKAALSQRFNFEGISSALAVMTKDNHLAVPHISVKDIRWIDWVELEKRGFKGVVFDKDNTLTLPYSLALWPPLESSLDSCKSVFGDNVAVFSNSAGLSQYDANGSKARTLEQSIGIHVIRHGVKKPGGSAEDIEKYFGCEASLLIMVGDRYFTDIVYGNRNGFLTILTQPLSLVEEPFVVKQVRKLEASLANYWNRRGLKPVCHSLLSEVVHCVKVPPPL